jgi:Asp-tRNA(Asn)/Glu-tRNA(Gln) amidotransferase A subunit family amidase
MPTQDTYFTSVRALGDAIRERRISPVELTEGYLERCMDKLGPMARTADDCALVLNVLAGHDPLAFAACPRSACHVALVKGIFLMACKSWGRALNDAVVLRAGRLYQAHTEWQLQHPSL